MEQLKKQILENCENNLFLSMRCKYSSETIDNHADIGWKFIEKDVKDFLSQAITTAYEKGRGDILKELNKEHRKFIKGFAYRDDDPDSLNGLQL